MSFEFLRARFFGNYLFYFSCGTHYDVANDQNFGDKDGEINRATWLCEDCFKEKSTVVESKIDKSNYVPCLQYVHCHCGLICV